MADGRAVAYELLPLPFRGACAAGGAVHVWVGCHVWSVEDPTGTAA